MTITQNGEYVTYNGIGKMGPDLLDSSKYSLTISGRLNNKPQTFDITIESEDSGFAPGIYRSNDTSFYTYICYFTSNDNGSNPVNYDNLHPLWGKDSSYYEITITSITDKEITGSFTGNFLVNTVYDHEKIDITDGVFKAKRWR